VLGMNVRLAVRMLAKGLDDALVVICIILRGL
jgi:hypothetical protein